MGMNATQIATQGMTQAGAGGLLLIPILLIGIGAVFLALAAHWMDDEWSHDRRRHGRPR